MSAPRSTGPRLELHAHTHFSDGTLSPAELVERAIAADIDALAITDHDTVDGVLPARTAADGRLEVIAGIEVSSTHEDEDLHLLGYFLDPANEPLRERLARAFRERHERTLAILERLAALGVPVSADEVFAAAGPGVVGRPHIAAALMRAGHVPSIEVAFNRLLGTRGAAYVPRPSFPTAEAIQLVHEAGGVAVLAHPGPLATRVVESLAEAGLDGVEVWHPMHNMPAQKRWYDTAKELGLVPSGGSDFHSPNRGAALGQMPVPARTLEDLRTRARDRSAR